MTGEGENKPDDTASAPPTEPAAQPANPPSEPQTNIVTPQDLEAYGKSVAERVRKEEKDKLYGEIESLRTKHRELAEENEKLKSQPTVDPNEEEKSRLSLKSLESRIGEMQSAMEAKDRQLAAAGELATQQTRALELKLHKQRVIDGALKAGEGFIESLVTGSSEAEIDAAMIAAKAEYVAIQNRVREEEEAKRRGAPLAGAPETGPGSGPTPAQPGVSPSGENQLTPQQILEMDPEEYLRREEEIRKMTGVGVDRHRLDIRHLKEKMR
jgi:hypothetical protein